MPLYRIKQRRQLGGRVYEEDEVVNVGMSYADLEKPEYKEWKRYLEPERPPAPAEETPLKKK